MNLKEIILSGFKSFADPTRIVFEDGVTCIVGPNGCGKSNVADAVRWVLGEQSAKTMRGSVMQDVIFSGTEARKRLNMCEVTLVFDNSNGLFDLPTAEVSMTRRLYSVGNGKVESEYELNKQRCQRRELVALFHSVGVGREGYSIIGQNRVTQIMTSKPEDRRGVFEEATGISTLKSQRMEIERQLETTKDNLTMQAGLIDEVERRLRPLEEQADKARQARELNEQLRYEEINTYLLKYENFSVETDRQRAIIREAEEGLADAESRMAELDAEEESQRRRNEELDGLIAALSDKLRLYSVGAEQKRGDERVLSERIEAFKRELAAALQDVEYSIRRTKEIDGLIADSEKKMKEGAQRAGEIERECADITRRMQEADARIREIEQLSARERESERSSMEDLATLRANEGSLTARQEAAQDRAEEVRAAIKKGESRRDGFKSQLEECLAEKSECTAFLDDKDGQSAALSAKTGELLAAERELARKISECEVSISNTNGNLKNLLDWKNQFGGYHETVRFLQRQAQRDPEVKRRICGTIADLVSTERRYEIAIETAFGNAMQNLVTATQADAKWLIEYLKQADAGRMTFLPVNGMAARRDSAEAIAALREEGAVGLARDLVKYDAFYEPVVSNLLGNTLVCDTMEHAIRIRNRYPGAFRIVLLDGDSIASSGAMTGGARKRDSHLLGNERRIKECETQLTRLRAQLETLKTAHAEAEKKIASAREEEDAFRTRVQEETVRFATLSQRELTLTSLISEAEADLTEYVGLLDALTRKADEIAGAVLDSERSKELLGRIRAEAEQEASARAEQGERSRADRETLAARLHELQLESASLMSARVGEEENIAHWKAEKEDLLGKVEELRAENEERQKKIESLSIEARDASLTEDDKIALAMLEKRHASATEERKRLRERQAALAEDKRAVLTRQTLLSEKKHAGELEISRAESALEAQRQRIEEEYGLTYETAVAMRDPGYDLANAASNITSLKRKIGQLGAINPHAEEDFASESARYEEMVAKRDDVQKCYDDLETALTTLKSEMLKQFNEGFSKINENFTHIFRELFGGGRAELQLVENEEDPLSAGVEIVACPPGKRLSKISLLSGGEQALTAIAILFAILKTNPMPFCILDEIEAALDDVNVGRFASYLKKFSKDTQFIVITHRKPTMNQADTLFGVTMEEKGVSKIVSVKLSDVETQLGGDTVID